jgi:hypothetical protein
MRTTVAFAFALLLAMSAAGCSEEPAGPGIVQVSWKLDMTTCAQADVDLVRVQLLQDQQAIYSQDAACGDGTDQLNDVEAGVYDLRLQGIRVNAPAAETDGTEDILYEGEYAGLKVRSGSAPSSPPETIVLKLKPGEIWLAWSFPQGQSTICSFNNVATVEVNITQAATSLPLLQDEFPCDPGDVPPETINFKNGFIVIEDVPAGEVDLVLFGISPDGKRTSQGTKTISILKGQKVQVLVTLEPCLGECV